MIFRLPVGWWLLSFFWAAISIRAQEAVESPSPTPEERKLYEFSCEIGKPIQTSAGIFDSAGRLIRVLWTMREAKEGGVVQGRWNGKDKEGKSVSPGEYTWKVVVNRSTYVNIGTIGNSGQPPTTSGHVPVFLEGVAVDAKEGVYTVHGWDEAHFSVIKWSSKDGHAEFNTDNAVNEALLRAITVEPDGSYAYVTGEREVKSENEKITKFGIWRLKLIPGQKTSKVEDFSKVGRNIAVSERNAELLEKTAARDRELIHMPLMSLAL
ncbi:MAG TPA: FlgD immunoglobulin-like domain containing protein, partial [Terrimicrobiaceae bacterium]